MPLVPLVALGTAHNLPPPQKLRLRILLMSLILMSTAISENMAEKLDDLADLDVSRHLKIYPSSEIMAEKA